MRNCLKTRDTPKTVARLGVDAWKGTLTPTLSQREREQEESPLPRFGGEGQGEGVCHDYRGLPAFETPSDARPSGLRASYTCSRHMGSGKNFLATAIIIAKQPFT